jgi:Signal transduction histidine kinase
MRVFNRIKEHIKKHLAEKQEEQMLFFRQRQKDSVREKELQAEQRRLNRQLHYLRHFRRAGPTEDRQALMKRMGEIQTELHELHVRTHLRQFESGTDADFNRYYAHIRLSRLFVLLFNLLLWGLLFWLIGLGSGLTVIAVLFAVTTTIGSVFEIYFQLKVSERILKPVDSLKKGVQEIAHGNYNVKVETENANEIASLIKAFNEMAQKLLESEKVKRAYEENRKALVANISHDLKTPITSIQGYVEALEDGKTPAQKVSRYLKIIQSNAGYMNRLVDDLFVFSKLDMQRLDFHFEQIHIRPFLNDMMEEFAIELEEKSVRFTYSDELAEDYIVKLDGKRVNQIMHNLISNAVKHGPGEGSMKIRVWVREINGLIEIAIADNGPGIPPESLPHIFERFYRVDAERTKNLESTGLGLAIAKELTEAHGGTIRVSSEVGGGSCFAVSIPWMTAIGKDEG